MSRFIRIIDLLAGVLLGLVVLLTFFEAALRYLFNVQIPDAYTLSGYAQGVAIFWGIASATYAGRHICVDILWEALGRVGKRGLDIISALICGGFLGVMAWMAVRKTMRSRLSFEVTNELQFPVWIFIAIGTTGLICACLFAFLRAADLARGKFSFDERDS